MSDQPTRNSDYLLLNQAIRQKVHEADFYLKQGLFSEAHLTYTELVNACRSCLCSNPEITDRVREDLKAHITAFGKKKKRFKNR